jgi:hypothetical protein
MHFHFDFSAAQIFWTLTFAALLVLLVVLLGRDRARRFPWFTASIALMGLLLLTTQLLLGRLSRISGSEIFLALSDLDVVVSLLVVVELARGAFRGAGRISWVVGTLALVAVGAVVVALWGPWPAWKTLTATSQLVAIRLMDLVAEKGNLLASVLAIELGLVVVLLGRRFKAGWRSHTQQIVIGLSTAAMAQLALRGTLQAIGTHTHIRTQAEYEHIMNLRDKLIHANNVVYLCVLVWWIAWLWFDEPGAPSVAAAPAEAAPAADDEAAPPEAPAAVEHSEPKSEGSDLSVQN